MDRLSPSDVAGVLARAQAWAAPGERLHPVPIDRVVIADDGLAALAHEVAARVTGPVLLVQDATPMRREGGDLKEQAATVLSRRLDLTVRTLAEPCHADLATARALAAEVPGYAAVVALGSGGVTDLVKSARELSGAAFLFASAPTAASVTAFSSALSVLLVDGVKRTIPSRPPELVVCDLPTLCAAPPAMNQAGFGDVLARSVSYGDWWLAAELGMATGFSHVPGRMLAASEEAMLAGAARLAQGDPDAVRAVMEALLLAGMAMSIVNQTTPLSGWEHVISHYLDMTAAYDGRAMALHGEQVGVATLVAARAYERAWAHLDPARLAGDLDGAAVRERIGSVFGPVDPSGAMVAEIWRDATKKLDQWAQAAPQRAAFARRLAAGDLTGPLGAMVRPSAEVAAALAAAGAPRTFADLTQPVSDATARAAVRHGHLIRSRFTLGDLLEVGGWLTDAAAAGLLTG